jgi:uncharacterized protein YjbI with pentapeptide repeats
MIASVRGERIPLVDETTRSTELKSDLRLIVLAVFAIALVALIFFGLNFYISPETPEQRKDLIQTGAQILGGVAILSGAYFAWRNLQINQLTLENNLRTTQATQEGLVLERFSRAIDQLRATDEGGQKILEARLAGIYSLEGVARESRTNYPAVINILTAYVRQHTPRKPIEDPEEISFNLSPTPDVQAVLTALGRRRSYKGSEDDHIDLRDTDLRGADLHAANLEGADLSGAQLEEANLFKANLKGAKLRSASLERAVLQDADLEGATIDDVFITPGMPASKGTPANLSRAVLTNASLKRADLHGARLEMAIIQNTNLEGAILSEAHLERAQMYGDTYLGEADLRRTNLQDTDLRGAKGLTQEQINQAIGDEYTQLPSNLLKPPGWKDADSST